MTKAKGTSKRSAAKLSKGAAPTVSSQLTLAVPKGRILKALAPSLIAKGFPAHLFKDDDRTLVREHGGLRLLLVKPDDVPTYVEYGTADLGIVGRDVFLERDYDLFVPLDLGIGRCRLSVAAPRNVEVKSLYALSRPYPLRVATKFTGLATSFFQKKRLPIEVIPLSGSVELGPITGLSDVIVDLVESGETLKQNGLVEIETIMEVSTVVVANRVSYKLKMAAVQDFIALLS